MAQVASKQSNAFSAKSSATRRVPVITHDSAKEHANKIYEHSTDLEVLLRHKVYPKTVDQINGVQVRLNKVRHHVKGNLKKKDLRKVKWQGVQEGEFVRGFFWGMLVGIGIAFCLLWSWFATTQSAP